jgi:hypothetical protein
MLAASGTAASAQEAINFMAATSTMSAFKLEICSDPSISIRKMFGFTVVSQAEEGGVKIVRLGNTKTLVSLNLGGPPGRDRDSPVHEGINHELFDAARRDSLTRRPGRLAHQGP